MSLKAEAGRMRRECVVYREFLERKVCVASSHGFERELHRSLHRPSVTLNG
jgi:hypothetical protein